MCIFVQGLTKSTHSSAQCSSNRRQTTVLVADRRLVEQPEGGAGARMGALIDEKYTQFRSMLGQSATVPVVLELDGAVSEAAHNIVTMQHRDDARAELFLKCNQP